MSTKLRTMRSFSAQDWILLAQAWSLLLAIDLALRIFPFRKVQAWIKPPGQTEGNAIEAEAKIQRYSKFVDLAARHHIYAMTCLRRSLALQWLLRRAGLEANLKFGVLRENGELLAHAWLEYRGQIIDQGVIPIEQFAHLKAKEVA